MSIRNELNAMLKETVQFTHTNGNHIAISPEVAVEAVIELLINKLPEKKPLVNSRPLEWDDHYHTKWNATVEGFNQALQLVQELLQ